jgi:hypothetical protein
MIPSWWDRRTKVAWILATFFGPLALYLATARDRARWERICCEVDDCEYCRRRVLHR